jgi:hypothetical protein
MSYYSTLAYQQHCVTRPIISSVVMGGLFTGISMAQGMRFTPQLALMNMGGLYIYHIAQCPMEAIHGRPSALHNAAAGAILGYAGVAMGQLGIPFVDSYFFYRHPNLPAPLVGGMVYGGIGFVLSAVLGGKPI